MPFVTSSDARSPSSFLFLVGPSSKASSAPSSVLAPFVAMPLFLVALDSLWSSELKRRRDF